MSDSNVVIANFINTKEITTAPIFQYDYGMVLKFGGVELPESYEVHFANYRYGASKVMIGDSTGVEIPYEYTKNYGRVFAWVFIHESEDVGWTKYLAEIPVIQRAKPSYDPVDPYEQSIVEQLVSTVEGLQDDVSGAQEDVETLQKKKADVIVSSASGSVAAFADGADDMPVESLKCYIEPVQSGSGTPSPSNVRAISGWTGVNVTMNGSTIHVTFPTSAGTVYGGYVDVVKGELVVDRKSIVLTGTNPWATSGNRFRAPKPSDLATQSIQIANMAKLISSDMTAKYSEEIGAFFSVTDSYIYINKLTNEDTRETVIQRLTNQPSTIIAMLSTPVLYHLTPQQLNTLLGSNSIYCDTGDVEVSYPADTKLYIDGKIAELQALVLEN